MPEDHVPQDDCSYWKENEFERYFIAWLTQANNGRPLSGNSASQKVAAPKESDDDIIPSRFSSFDDPFDDEPSSTTWQRYQSVTHNTFGRGVIEKVEQKSDTTYLTVRFRSGIKKLDAAFVKTI